MTLILTLALYLTPDQVGRDYPDGIRSFMTSYGTPKTAGTLVCVDGPYAALTRRLSLAEQRSTAFGHTRR